MLTDGKQIAAARQLLGWSQADLATRSGVSKPSIIRIEKDLMSVKYDLRKSIEKTVNDNGIEFTPRGVQEKNIEITKLSGTDGFKKFMWDVYQDSSENGCDICLFNARPEYWTKWLGEEWYNEHANRMSAITDKNVTFRGIAREDDTNFIANSFGEYRWFPKELFNEKSFYAYGDKLGFLNFEKDTLDIFVIDHRDFTSGCCMGKNGHHPRKNERILMNKNLLLFIGDDFVSTLFLNEFIPQVVEMGVNPIILTVESNQSDQNSAHELKRYNFYQKNLLQRVLFPLLESSSKSNFKLLTPQQIFDQDDLQVIETSNVNDAATLDQIKKINFIGAISVRCFQIFGSRIISTIKDKGFFCNSHPGVLPDYRGVYCLLRGLVNGDEKLGWTLHDIDTGIDTGHVIKEVPFYNFNSRFRCFNKMV